MIAGTLRVPATPARCAVYGTGRHQKLRCTSLCLWAQATEMRACAGVLVRRSCTSMGTGVELRSTLAALAKGERSSPVKSLLSVTFHPFKYLAATPSSP